VHLNKIFNTLINWRDFRLKLFVQGIVDGILASTLVVLFRLILEKSDLWLQQLYTVLRSGSSWPISATSRSVSLCFSTYLITAIWMRK